MSLIRGEGSWAVRANRRITVSNPTRQPKLAQKLRVRSETFADHYSQARQFYISQTPVEQQHIAASFTFELSKVETPAIRSRMVAHLLNVDKSLAEAVGSELGLQSMPKPAEPARAPRTDLKALRSLSISLNCPRKFTGRKLEFWSRMASRAGCSKRYGVRSKKRAPHLK